MKQPNIIALKMLSSKESTEDYTIRIQINSWLAYVGAFNNSKNGELWCDMINRPDDKRPGRAYHKWLRSGYLIHQYGFNVANHFIR